MKQTIALLEQLVKLPGIPGREDAVIEFLRNYPLEAVSRKVDISGNIFIECDGPRKPPLILAAHMDEIGARVKKIEEDGRVSVIGLENLDLRTLAGQIMQIWSVTGVHQAFVYLNQKTTHPKDYADLTGENIRLDLGLMNSSATAARGIKPNDPVTFSPELVALEDGMLCAKAFDNRSSLAAIVRALELTRADRKQRPVLLGTVQEEIGGWGAKAVAFSERPGAVLVLDICGAEVFRLSESERRTIMGRGPILLNNPGTNNGLCRRLVELAAERDIPVQQVGYYDRGADPAILQTSSGGFPMMTIILPMAYYHAPKGLIHAADVYNTARLLAAVIQDDLFLESVSVMGEP